MTPCLRKMSCLCVVTTWIWEIELFLDKLLKVMFCRNRLHLRKCNRKEVGAWSSQRKMKATNGWEWSPSCISALSVKSQRADWYPQTSAFLGMRKQKWHLLRKQKSLPKPVKGRRKTHVSIKERYKYIKNQRHNQHKWSIPELCVSAHAFKSWVDFPHYRAVH